MDVGPHSRYDLKTLPHTDYSIKMSDRQT